MKKFLLILSLTIFIVIVVLCFGGKDKSEFIRININANSNLQKDTEVRKIIKDEIVEFLNSYIEGDYDIEKVKNIINEKVKIKKVPQGITIKNFYGGKRNEKQRFQSTFIGSGAFDVNVDAC